MCGIAGFCDFTNSSDESTLVRMTDTLAHRGPDDAGYKMYYNNSCSIGLGHRRLSIIDLSSRGHQPMEIDNTGLTIVYNGEVYNHTEIRKELEKEGISFQSECDTEVVVRAYYKWGPEMLNRFIGMFSFCIYDHCKGELFFARDRAGVKPLYYYWDGALFLFASELKAFHKHKAFKAALSKQSIAAYFRYGFVPAPSAIFENTYKLEQGHYFTFKFKNRSIERRKYWDVIDYYNLPKMTVSFDETIGETERILTNAFRYRLVSDVPVAVFLSGGYDSTAIATLLQKDMTDKLHTFTIGFNEKEYDEAPFARRISRILGTEHEEHYCNLDDAKELIPMLPEAYDEPFADSSAIPTMLLAKLTSRIAKVALSGDGGDETFGGYGKYWSNQKVMRYLSILPSSLRKMVSIVLSSITRSDLLLYGWERIFGDKSIETRLEVASNVAGERNAALTFRHKAEVTLLTKQFIANLMGGRIQQVPNFYDDSNLLKNKNDPVNGMLALDYKTYLCDDILCKVDRATMWSSLESREPLLDHRIIEWVARLPSQFKVTNTGGKQILKAIVHKYIPESEMDRPKKGFGIPLSGWLAKDLHYLIREYLSDKAIRKYCIFDMATVRKIVRRFDSNPNISIDKLWLLLVFQMWCARWAK